MTLRMVASSTTKKTWIVVLLFDCLFVPVNQLKLETKKMSKNEVKSNIDFLRSEGRTFTVKVQEKLNTTREYHAHIQAKKGVTAEETINNIIAMYEHDSSELSEPISPVENKFGKNKLVSVQVCLELPISSAGIKASRKFDRAAQSKSAELEREEKVRITEEKALARKALKAEKEKDNK